MEHYELPTFELNPLLKFLPSETEAAELKRSRLGFLFRLGASAVIGAAIYATSQNWLETAGVAAGTYAGMDGLELGVRYVAHRWTRHADNLHKSVVSITEQRVNEELQLAYIAGKIDARKDNLEDILQTQIDPTS